MPDIVLSADNKANILYASLYTTEHGYHSKHFSELSHLILKNSKKYPHLIQGTSGTERIRNLFKIILQVESKYNPQNSDARVYTITPTLHCLLQM